MTGGFNKKTIEDVSLKGKRVLLRADYNVPLVEGKVAEAYRIEASLPTIKYLVKQGAKAVVIISHLGRPGGRVDKTCSLQPVAEKLQDLLGKKVEFASDCIGEAAQTAAAAMPEGGVLVLENLRFHPGEEANDPAFAKQLAEASGANIFVQDGFGVVHRPHASTSAITKLLPSVAGLLLEKEVNAITQTMQKPARPLVAVLGGAKASDKIELIEKFIDIADCVALAGSLANTFLLAKKVEIGASQAEPEQVGLAKKIMAKAEAVSQKRPFQLLLPVDGVVSVSKDGTKPTRIVDLGSGLADEQSYPKLPPKSAYTLAADEMILDIGPATSARIAGAIAASRSVIWNGTAGITEVKGIAGVAAPYSHGTRTIVEAMIGANRKSASRPHTLVGGGDTASYLEQQGLVEDFDFVSTGGGATLELMAGHKLPGIEALPSK